MRARFQSGVWALHSFRLLISASMISIFGSLITSTAFPFIAIHELDAGPAELALLSLAGIVPSIVLGSVAGIWIDRISRRQVMIASDLLSAAALLTIPIANAGHRPALPDRAARPGPGSSVTAVPIR
jgi:MFS family permease